MSQYLKPILCRRRFSAAIYRQKNPELHGEWICRIEQGMKQVIRFSSCTVDWFIDEIEAGEKVPELFKWGCVVYLVVPRWWQEPISMTHSVEQWDLMFVGGCMAEEMICSRETAKQGDTNAENLHQRRSPWSAHDAEHGTKDTHFIDGAHVVVLKDRLREVVVLLK